MQLKEAYLQRTVAEVEELAERVAVLKARIAKQKVSVKSQGCICAGMGRPIALAYSAA